MKFDEKHVIMKLPEIAEVIKQQHLVTRKRFGQHYITDQCITDKIVKSAGNLQNKIVVEIGPGVGSLTRSLLTMSSTPKVIAIEMDQQFKHTLTQLVEISNGRLDVIYCDAVQFNLLNSANIINACRENNTCDIAIIANLPYNIGTCLLIHWMDLVYQCMQVMQSKNATTSRDTLRISDMVIMLQAEVVERIVATPGNKEYGALSILIQWLCDVEKLFLVDPSCFLPSPRVMSCVMRLVPKYGMQILCNKKALLDLCHTCFGARRKMLRRSLKHIIQQNSVVADYITCHPHARPEELSIDEFIYLASVLQNK